MTNNKDSDKRYEEVFRSIGVNRSEFQTLWAYGNPLKRIIHDTLKSFLHQELDRAREDLKKKIDLLIIQRMQKYANTPLKDRTNAFDVLYEINLEILKLLK